jgi:hypothetical protein
MTWHLAFQIVGFALLALAVTGIVADTVKRKRGTNQ